MIPDLTFEAKTNNLSQNSENEKNIPDKDDKKYSQEQIEYCTSIFKDVDHVLETKFSERNKQIAQNSNSSSNPENFIRASRKNQVDKYRSNSITFEDENETPNRRSKISDDFFVLHKSNENLHSKQNYPVMMIRSTT